MTPMILFLLVLTAAEAVVILLLANMWIGAERELNYKRITDELQLQADQIRPEEIADISHGSQVPRTRPE